MTEIEMLTKRVDALAEVQRSHRNHLAEIRRVLSETQRQIRELEAAAGLRRQTTMTAWPRGGKGD
jgi:prefoldin subunit 5